MVSNIIIDKPAVLSSFCNEIISDGKFEKLNEKIGV